MNRLLRYLRRNKRKCSRCEQWRQSLDFNGEDMFTGDWCWRCASKQQDWILELIGAILVIRAQGRDDFVDLSETADRLIRELKKAGYTHWGTLWTAHQVAVDCEVE